MANDLLSRYSDYFDYYIENGCMPTDYTLDPLSDYLQEVLSDPSNKYLCLSDELWKISLKQSLLDFFKQMLNKFRPLEKVYAEEMKLLNKFKDAEIDDKRKLWSEVVRSIAKSYGSDEVNLKGYTFMLSDPGFDNEMLFEMMCDEWGRAALGKLQRDKQSIVQQLKKGFANKIRDYGPTDYFTIKEVMLQYYNHPTLADILKKLGREQEVNNDEEDRVKTQYEPLLLSRNKSTGDIDGVKMGDNLHMLLPSELALLADSDCEMLFYERFVSKKLQQFSFCEYDQRLVKSIERIKKPRAELGPVIICIDTSGSMRGEGESLAKSLVVQAWDMLRRKKRRCFVITYSVRSSTIELTAADGLSKLKKFLSMGFTGGTCGEDMLSDTFKALSSENFSLADVLIISDFYFQPPLPETEQRIKVEKSMGTRFYGFTVSNYVGGYADILDGVWRV